MPADNRVSITGTLAGQVVDGRIHGLAHPRPWVRRLITRLIAIVPAILVIGIYGDNHVNSLLVASQVILGLQLPFAMIPLMLFTSRRKYMGNFVNGKFVLIAGWTAVALITALDIVLLCSMLAG